MSLIGVHVVSDLSVFYAIVSYFFLSCLIISSFSIIESLDLVRRGPHHMAIKYIYAVNKKGVSCRKQDV